MGLRINRSWYAGPFYVIMKKTGKEGIIYKSDTY